MLTQEKFDDLRVEAITKGEVWFFHQIKPHLQQPFDRETVESVIRMITRGCAVGKGEEAIALGLKHLKALHTGGSEINREAGPEYEYGEHLFDGKKYTCERRHYQQRPCPHCKPVCGTCGGSGRVASHDWTKCGENCEYDSHWKPCPDCKPERCLRCKHTKSDCLKDPICYMNQKHRFTDERGEQQRKGLEHIMESSIYGRRYSVHGLEFEEGWRDLPKNCRVADRRTTVRT